MAEMSNSFTNGSNAQLGQAGSDDGKCTCLIFIRSFCRRLHHRALKKHGPPFKQRMFKVAYIWEMSTTI